MGWYSQQQKRQKMETSGEKWRVAVALMIALFYLYQDVSILFIQKYICSLFMRRNSIVWSCTSFILRKFIEFFFVVVVVSRELKIILID